MKVDKVTARIGARVSGIDLSQPLSAETVGEIRAALLDNAVLFFTGQRPLSPDEHVRLARYFGEIDVPEFAIPGSARPEVMTLDQINPQGQGSDSWHADNTYLEAPPMGALLQAHILPSVGGDTCFANMCAAYDGLSPAMKAFFEPLTASHGTEKLVRRTRRKALYKIPEALANRPPVSHPVIAVHPETGRRLLNVNNNWTLSIDGLPVEESEYWLRFLLEHVRSPEYQVRHRWEVGDIAFWDNRCTQHYGVADYTERRLMQRIVISGTPPLSIGEEPMARREPAAA